MNTRDKELRDLLDQIAELPNAISADRETGSHHLNNEASMKWAKENRFLLQALNKLQVTAQAMDPK